MSRSLLMRSASLSLRTSRPVAHNCPLNARLYGPSIFAVQSWQRLASSSASAATAAADQHHQPSTASAPFEFHGGGLSALHEQPQNAPQWRLKLSDRLTRVLMATEKSKRHLLSKKLYIQLDRLSPELLQFFYGDDANAGKPQSNDSACGIPRKFQSWFALTQLHVWMLQTRLRDEGKAGQIMHAGLVDHFTTDIEMKLWHAGISNVRVYDRHLHELLSFHYGCVLAYDEGYEAGDPILASALWRYAYMCAHSMMINFFIY